MCDPDRLYRHNMALTINRNAIIVSPVIRPLNHITSPYAWNRTMRNVTRPRGETYYKDNGQVLENCVDRYGEMLLRTIDSEMARNNPLSDTYETLGPGVYNTDEQGAHGKPCFRILSVKFSKRNDAQLLDSMHACDTNNTLQREQEEGHIELTSRYHELRWGE